MEICFVPSGDYRDVVRARAPQALRAGSILDADGRELGLHGGTALFTVGQRRGLPGGQKEPLYVTEVDPSTDTVRVGIRSEGLRATFPVGGVVYSGAAAPAPGTVVAGDVKIRAHHVPVPGRALVLEGGRLSVTLDRGESGVAPGQAAVIYQGDRVLCGGWIEREPPVVV
jgi:tRNA-specific 2-thiouridylase